MKRWSFFLVCCLAFVVAIPCDLFAAKIEVEDPAVPRDEKTWHDYYSIQEIRNIVKHIHRNSENGIYEEGHVNCKVYINFLYTKKKLVRFYLRESSDESFKTKNYYDENGTLRFSYVLSRDRFSGAGQYAWVENRFYFARSGRKIWQVENLLEDPDHKKFNTKPDDVTRKFVVFDPLEDLKRHNCLKETFFQE